MGQRHTMVQTKNIFTQFIKIQNSSLKREHDSPTAGHVGFFKTYHNIHQSLFWKGIKADIHKYVVECDTCQRQELKTLSPPSLVQPLHILAQKWSKVSMYFITSLPTSEGNDSIFVVVDILT